ncbi:MAG: AI-2E family transporter [Cyanobacteria bacterium REEB67]|nr:AI-2E family transporter [Cyanobacteria bacterium REEB67]
MPDGDQLLLLQRKLTIIALGLFILIVALQLFAMFADVLHIVGISVLISYLFINIVDWLEKYMKNRAMAIFAVYTLCGAAFFLALLTVVPYIVYQINQLMESVFSQLPQQLSKLFSLLAPLDAKLHAAQLQVKTIDLVTTLVQSMPHPDATMIFNRFSDLAMSTATWVAYGLSVLVVSFYYLLEGYGMTDHLIEQFPLNYHSTLKTVVSEIDKSLQAFFRGQIVLGFAFGAVMLVVYLILGVPFALVLGLFLAVWEVIPVIGPPLGFIPCLVVVALNGMDNVHLDRIWQVILITVVFNLAQWLRDNLVAPKYIGNAVGLHPVTIFLAILVGAKIDGLLGIIFSIPVASALHVIYSHFKKPNLLPLQPLDTADIATPAVISPDS